MTRFPRVSEYRAALRRVRDRHGRAPLFVHTDFARLGFLEGISPREQALDAYLLPALDGWSAETLGLPTFNYDFCRTGLYRVHEDVCQVGLLNERFRTAHATERTRTPVFHFALSQAGPFKTAAVSNPFGADSTFAAMVETRSVVAFLGAPFASNTFVHHVEEVRGVGYRYVKRFPGRIVSGGTDEPIEIEYRVRPLDPSTVQYDWPRLEAELLDLGILSRVSLGRADLLFFSAPDLLAFWLDRLGRDELYLLTPASRAACEAAGRLHGYPFTLERFEPPEVPLG